MRLQPILCLGLLLIQSLAAASGLEKAVTWSGRYSGIANAATSSVRGAEALYFNPAALTTTQKAELAVNLSPSFIQFEGPFPLGQETSETTFVPPFSVIGAWKKNRWAYGAGVFAVAGNASDFGTVDISTEFNSFEPEFKGRINAIEFSLGTAYQVNEKLSLGVAWRASFVTGELKFGTYEPGASQFAMQTDELSDSKFVGFRLGLLYRHDEKLGFGIAIRTPVKFKAEGSATGQLETPSTGGTAISLRSSEVTTSATLPLSVALGFDYGLSPHLTVYCDLSWMNYEQNDDLELSGTLTDDSNTVSVPLSNIAIEWTNGIAFRLAGEYRTSLPVRFGYVLGTPISSKGRAQPILEAPGYGHVFTLGTGRSFSETLEWNIGAEYAFVGGEVSADDAVSATSGDYKTTGYAAHFGLTWYFK